MDLLNEHKEHKEPLLLPDIGTFRCGNCKWMGQGKGGCQCFNPDQKDKFFKQYVYWSFICDLITFGKHETEEELLARGYIKKRNKITAMSGEDLSFDYYELPKKRKK